MTIGLADYGVGNLHSIRKALENAGGNVIVIENMNELLDVDCIVFPGVGAFDKTIKKISPYRSEIKERLNDGVPALGICIGSHILFNGSQEGSSKGLGFIDGDVVKLKAKQIPHIGWNSVESDDIMFEGVDNMHFYFAHSFYGIPSDSTYDDTGKMTEYEMTVKGTTEYENVTIPTFFRKRNVVGCQFHPEKSSVSGNTFISNFIKFAEGCM